MHRAFLQPIIRTPFLTRPLHNNSRKKLPLGIIAQGVVVAAFMGRSEAETSQAGGNSAPNGPNVDAPKKAAIVTTLGCKFCKRSKEVLRERNIPFDEYDLSDDTESVSSLSKKTILKFPFPVHVSSTYSLLHYPSLSNHLVTIFFCCHNSSRA